MCDSGIYYTGDEYEEKLAEELGIEGFDDLPEEDRSGTYKLSVRQMLFPGGFWQETKELLNGACCAECETTSDLTLDHIWSVSAYFNEIGYKKTREERTKWYNDTSNLRVLCRRCNSQKGGERFEPKKVEICWKNKLIQ